jgi:thymidylate kinase
MVSFSPGVVMADSGLSLALMGIDGAGKSTLVSELRRVLGAGGREVLPVTWESTVTAFGGDRTGYPLATLEMLGIEGWRLMYAAPAHPDRTLYEDIPRWIAEEGPRGMLSRLPADPVGGHQAALVTSALLEMTGHQLIQAEVVVPALARGAVTLCDGFGYKNVVKVLRMAQLMPGPFPAATLDMLLDCALRTFGDPFMQPEIGLLLDADAELTYEWRISQERRLGPAEDLSLAGRPGRESYLEFQAGLAKEYRAAAEAWGWRVLPVDGRPQAQTVAEALDVVLAALPADRDRHTGAAATR